MGSSSPARQRGLAVFVFTLLAIEFLDEFTFGAREAAWPLIRDDLHLSYEQIGLLLSLPLVLASLIEPALGILGDVWKRRVVVLGGGVVFTLGLLLTAASVSFGLLMLAFILLAPASGAFVSLSQAALMDIDPARHEHNMARWTFAGSVGVVSGSLVLGALAALGLGWRGLFLFAAGLSLILLIVARRFPFASPQYPAPGHEPSGAVGFKAGLRNALHALRRREVVRWLVLLQCSDLMLDILYGYLALYLVDVVGIDEAQAGLAVTVWTGVGVIGDLLLIPLLERVRGLSYLRISAAIESVLFPAFLLVPGLAPKLVILALLGLFNSGWYAVLQGQLYSSMPGQSGTVLAVNNVSGLVGSLIPLGIGFVAERLGLGTAIWLLMLGPVALLIGLPAGRPIVSAAAQPVPPAENTQEPV
jgi:FSR family fosmidomycin resistance protein-like MFS transporter